MLTSLALIFLVGLSAAAICGRLRLPRIIGMLFTGIILGPHVLGLLDDKILSISSELRQMALIIILLKAGLSLNLADLKKVGRPAVMMSFVPASFEICGYLLCAPMILGITRIEAAVMGAVLAAVSPAVVVPRMVQLMESGYGTKKSIPQMILAGASCDDIFVIVLFSTFSGMAQGGTADMKQFLNIPVSIVLGILLGAVVGYLLSLFFETAYAKAHYVRKQYEGHDRSWSFLPSDGCGDMGEGLCISVRSAGRSQHGMRSEDQMPEICLRKTLGEIRKALDRGGSCLNLYWSAQRLISGIRRRPEPRRLS